MAPSGDEGGQKYSKCKKLSYCSYVLKWNIKASIIVSMMGLDLLSLFCVRTCSDKQRFLRCLVGFAEAGHRYNFAFFVHTLSLVDSSVVLSSSRCCNIKLYQVLSLKCLLGKAIIVPVCK